MYYNKGVTGRRLMNDVNLRGDSNFQQQTLNLLNNASPEVQNLAKDALKLLSKDGKLTDEQTVQLLNQAEKLIGLDILSDSEKAELTSWSDNLKALAQEDGTSIEDIAESTRETLTTSTDEGEVLDALMQETGLLNDSTITPEQKTRLSDALGELAKEIAEQNGSSTGSPNLKSLTASTVLDEFKALLSQAGITLTAEDSSVLQGKLLARAATNLASLNAASGDTPPLDPLFVALSGSKDEAVIEEALKKGADLSGLSEDEKGAVNAALKELAGKIAEHSAGTGGIESTDIATILLFLEQIGATSVGNPVLTAALNSFAAKVAAVNKTKWEQDTYSLDPKVVEKALQKMSNVEYDKSLTAAEQKESMDYLKIMSQVLAFMSQIRARVAQMDSALQKYESMGKLANIKDQTAVAKNTYETTLKKIENMIQKMEKAKEQKLVMQILMPVLSSVAMAISVAVIVIGTVASICTAGATAEIVVIGVAMMCFSISMTVSLTVGTTVLSSTNAVEKMSSACGIQDPMIQSYISLAVQLTLVAICTIMSLGACAVIAPGQAISTSTEAGIQAALKAIQTATNALVIQMMKQLGMWLQIASALGSAVFASGVITQTATKILKACGVDDKDAEMGAMIITIVLMMLMIMAIMTAGAGSLMGGAGQGAQTAAKATQSATSATEDLTLTGTTTATTAGKTGTITLEATEEAAKTAAGQTTIAQHAAGTADKATDAGVELSEAAATTGSSSAQAAGNVANETGNLAKTSTTTLQDLNALAKKFAEMLKDPFLYIKLIQDVGVPITQVGAEALEQGTTIGYNVQQAQLTKTQISITKDTIKSQAILTELKSLLQLTDETTAGLSGDLQNMMADFGKLLNTYQQMVQGASDITTQLHQTA